MVDVVENDDVLDSWYADDDEEDQTAGTTVTADAATSAPSNEAEGTPVQEDPESHANALDEGTSTEPEPVAENPYAWIDELDDTVREKAESLANAVKSGNGRVAALRSQLDQVTAEKEAQKITIPNVPSVGADVPGQKDVVDMDDAELDQFLEEFPTVARSVEKLQERRARQLREEMLAEIRPVQENLTQQTLVKQKEELRRNASIIFNEAETGIQLEDVVNSPAWAEWLQSRSPAYQQMANSVQSAQDASQVLADFATEMQRQAHWEAQQAGEQIDQQNTEEADQVAARRRSALSAPTPPSRSANLDIDGNLGSYEAEFDAAVARG
jgi:hypothetical protein